MIFTLFFVSFYSLNISNKRVNKECFIRTSIKRIIIVTFVVLSPSISLKKKRIYKLPSSKS